MYTKFKALICPSEGASCNNHCATARSTEPSCQFVYPKPCLYNFKHCSRIMNLKSKILLGMNVIFAMVMMEPTTENVRCAGNMTSNIAIE